MESGINEKIAKTLSKAEESIKEAEILLLQDLFSGSVSRSYYAAFHATCALLLTKGLEFSKHSAVIAAFGHHFVREGLIEKKYHKFLIDAFEARQIAEYDIFKQISHKFADKILHESKEFVSMVNQYVRDHYV